MKYIVTMRAVVEQEIETVANSPHEAVDAMRVLAEHKRERARGIGLPLPLMRAESVEWGDGDTRCCKLVVGYCEGCSRPILEGDIYASDEECCDTCAACLRNLTETG